MNNLKQILDNEGLSQAEVAREAKLSTTTLNKLYTETAKNNPSNRTKTRICQAINKLCSDNEYSVEDIFTEGTLF